MSLYLRDGQGQRGPLDESTVQQALASGELSLDVMSWREGEAGWISLARRYRRKDSDRLSALLVLSSLLVLAASSVALPIWGYSTMPSKWRDPILFTAFASVSALACIGSIVFHSRRATGWRARSRITLASLVAGLLLIVGAASLLRFWQIESARKADPDALVTVSRDQRVIRIEGAIGAQFVHQIQVALHEATRLQRIEINSPGGLVSDALQVADMVRERGLTVRAAGECASACVVVWAASPSRQIRYDTAIGLHQTSMAEGESKVWDRITPDASGKEMDVHLERSGFSPELLKKRRETKPDEMSWLTPLELQEHGLTAEVIDNQGHVANEAQTVMADVLWRDGAEDDLTRAYLALARVDPDHVLRVAKAMRKAQLDKQDDELAKLSSGLARYARTFALMHSGNAPLLDWARRHEQWVSRALRDKDASACGTLISASERNDHDAMRQRRLSDLADLLEAMEFRPAAEPSAQQISRARALIRGQFQQRARRGLGQDWDRWSELQRCGLVRDVYRDALALSSADAAAAVRVIEDVVQ